MRNWRERSNAGAASSYAHVPWIKPAQKNFEDRQQLPEAEAKLAMFALAHEMLTGAGYMDVGLVTRIGVPLLRVIAMRFDPSLSTGPREHSRTISVG